MTRFHGPGSRLGIMGSGQLGRMLALEARRMGYRIHVFGPEENSPAGRVADVDTVAGYDNEPAVRGFARGVDVLTFEFENIPRATIEQAAGHCEVHPSPDVLHIAQNRIREKEFLARHGFPLAAWRVVSTPGELAAAAEATGFPCVLKTAAFGYDGKGQRKISSSHDLASADPSGGPHVLEAWVPFGKEISVVVARGADGGTAVFPVAENIHRAHILDCTVVPARIAADTAARAGELAARIADRLGLVGVMAVEMFLLADGTILVNELAPRPHNSGHFTLDACVTSQFEQQLRAVCGWPLGPTDLLRPCAMANLLGDLWQDGEPRWAAASTRAKLHLYGKRDPRPGRKMGHLLSFGATPGEALETVQAARASLVPE